jgi:hypothetical protein
MKPWGFVFGALALSLMLVGMRLMETVPAGAQSTAATPAASSSIAPSNAQPGAKPDGFDPAQRYDDFVAKLAANLGQTDATKVDAAIRATLKQTIDEQQAAGDLTADQATALKQRIDTADVPLGFMGGPRGGMDHGGFNGRDGGPDHGSWDQDQDQGERDNTGKEPANSLTPTATAAL